MIPFNENFLTLNSGNFIVKGMGMADWILFKSEIVLRC